MHLHQISDITYPVTVLMTKQRTAAARAHFLYTFSLHRWNWKPIVDHHSEVGWGWVFQKMRVKTRSFLNSLLQHSMKHHESSVATRPNRVHELSRLLPNYLCCFRLSPSSIIKFSPVRNVIVERNGRGVPGIGTCRRIRMVVREVAAHNNGDSSGIELCNQAGNIMSKFHKFWD